MTDSTARELKGHNILALERFADSTRHMVEFLVKMPATPYGSPGDEVRLFLTDAGYRQILSLLFLSEQTAQVPEPKRKEMTPTHEYQIYRELIQENIEYQILCKQFPYEVDTLDEIVELMTEVVCAKRKFTRVAGSDFPHEAVKSRLLKLDSQHIQFVMDCMKENTTKVKNIKQYLLTVLFNAPITISNYYTALVNHDLYGGGSQ